MHGGKNDMKRKAYEEELRRLQTKLCTLQEWVKHKGLRVVVVFEGRDTAGKGGTIKAITERVSPRVSALSRCRLRPIAKSHSYISSATSRTSRRPEKSSFSIELV